MLRHPGSRCAGASPGADRDLATKIELLLDTASGLVVSGLDKDVIQIAFSVSRPASESLRMVRECERLQTPESLGGRSHGLGANTIYIGNQKCGYPAGPIRVPKVRHPDGRRRNRALGAVDGDLAPPGGIRLYVSVGGSTGSWGRARVSRSAARRASATRLLAATEGTWSADGNRRMSQRPSAGMQRRLQDPGIKSSAQVNVAPQARVPPGCVRARIGDSVRIGSVVSSVVSHGAIGMAGARSAGADRVIGVQAAKRRRGGWQRALLACGVASGPLFTTWFRLRSAVGGLATTGAVTQSVRWEPVPGAGSSAPTS